MFRRCTKEPKTRLLARGPHFCFASAKPSEQLPWLATWAEHASLTRGRLVSPCSGAAPGLRYQRRGLAAARENSNSPSCARPSPRVGFCGRSPFAPPERRRPWSPAARRRYGRPPFVPPERGGPGRQRHGERAIGAWLQRLSISGSPAMCRETREGRSVREHGRAKVRRARLWVRRRGSQSTPPRLKQHPQISVAIPMASRHMCRRPSAGGGASQSAARRAGAGHESAASVR